MSENHRKTILQGFLNNSCETRHRRGENVKPAGVVRKVDQLGRIVLPKSLRKRYLMNEGDPVEIFVQGDHIILERYRPKCVFCGSMVDVRDFKERYVCGVCMEEMAEMKH